MGYTEYHPVYLDLNGRRVLIVGGGSVALEKIEALLPRSGAKIDVLAPKVRSEVQHLVKIGKVSWIEKSFDPGDVEPYFMVIAATDDPTVNAAVFRAGHERHKLSNSVDDPANCNFIMAAIVSSGPMQAAISSAGCSPALAQRIRDRIAKEMITPETGELAEYLGSWRAEVKSTLPDYRTKKAFWEAVLDSGAPTALAAGRRDEADEELKRLLADFAKTGAEEVLN
jgi:uroporphyrin-III C-methyltransferase/precorrin-2 dehydrogenase/sirohydrochlorin ferrochelatase